MTETPGTPKRTPSSPLPWLMAALVLGLAVVGAILLRSAKPDQDANNTNRATVNNAFNTNAVANTNATNGIPYRNVRFAFALTFPNNWDGFAVTEHVNIDPTTNAPADYSVVTFEHPKRTSEDGRPGKVGFSISIYADPNIQIPMGVRVITTRDEIRYAYSKSNAAAPGELENSWNQIEGIIATFSLQADWLIYRDERSQRTIQYPPDWEPVTTSYATVGFRPRGTQIGDSEWAAIYLTIRPNPNVLALESFYAEAKDFVDLFEVSTSHEPRTVGQYSATYFPVIPGAVTNAAIAYSLDDNVIEVQMHRDEIDKIAGMEDIFFGIAASVR